MQNQFEINEKEIEKEIEEEKLKCANYKIIGKESYIPIKLEDLEKLKKSKFISTPFKTKKPSNEINLLFEMLFDEILLIILSYLSPGEIILFSLTCKEAEYICSDYFLWKQISIKFQDYFSWNSAFFDTRKKDYSPNHLIYQNIELIATQFKIQEKNQNDPKQKQIKELSKTNEKIKNYFDNSNSTIIRLSANYYRPNFISIKKLKYSKKYIFLFQKNRPPQGSRKYLITDVNNSLNGIIFISTFFILNYYIDSKKEIPIFKIFFLEEIDLIITLIWNIYSKNGFYSKQEYYNLQIFLISSLLFMVLISLKISIIFKSIPWIIILFLPILDLIIFIPQLISFSRKKPFERNLSIILVYNFGFLIFVLLFTGLKLDGLIQIKYSKLIYLLIIICFFLYVHLQDQLENYFDSFGIAFSFGFVYLIFFLLIFYGDGNIKRLWIALIPIHIILLFFYLFFVPIFISSLFKLIQKIIKNEN